MNRPTLPLVLILLVVSPLPKKDGEKITTVEERLAKPRRPAPSGIGFEDKEFRDKFFEEMMSRHLGRLVII